jgi:hypothetical protein
MSTKTSIFDDLGSIGERTKEIQREEHREQEAPQTVENPFPPYSEPAQTPRPAPSPDPFAGEEYCSSYDLQMVEDRECGHLANAPADEQSQARQAYHIGVPSNKITATEVMERQHFLAADWQAQLEVLAQKFCDAVIKLGYVGTLKGFEIYEEEVINGNRGQLLQEPTYATVAMGPNSLRHRSDDLLAKALLCDSQRSTQEWATLCASGMGQDLP